MDDVFQNAVLFERVDAGLGEIDCLVHCTLVAVLGAGQCESECVLCRLSLRPLFIHDLRCFSQQPLYPLKADEIQRDEN